MAGKPKFTCAQIIEALHRNKGMVYLAAKSIPCSHQTVYNYIARHPTVKRAFDEENGLVGDVAELKLYQAIQEGEHWAIAFYLKTKGKHRGYTERQELTGADGQSLAPSISIYLPEKQPEGPFIDQSQDQLDDDSNDSD